MQIDIIGAGAIGLLYGAKLTEAGVPVTVWTRTEQQALRISREGVCLRTLSGDERLLKLHCRWIGEGEESSAYTRTDNRDGSGESSRILLLTVKQTALDDNLLSAVKRILNTATSVRESMLIGFQNGIGHMERMSNSFPNLAVLAAVTTEGARRLDSRTVQHTGAGKTWFGSYEQNDNRNQLAGQLQKMFVKRLLSAGFSSEMSNQMEIHIFYKLMINAIINPLTALFDVKNGQLPEHQHRLQLMKAMYAETELVLRSAGKPVNPNGWQQILDVCAATRDNISSMLADVHAGRKTEIDAINGQIVRLAAQHEVKAPLNEAVTEFVNALFLRPDLKE